MLEGWDPQRDTETWKGLWWNSGVWDQDCPSTSSSLLRCPGGEDTELYLPLRMPMTVPGVPRVQSKLSDCHPPPPKSLLWLDWWNVLLRAWSAFQDPPPAETPRNPKHQSNAADRPACPCYWPSTGLSGFLRAPKNPKGSVFVLQSLQPVVSPVLCWLFRPSLNQLSADTSCLTGY